MASPSGSGAGAEAVLPPPPGDTGTRDAAGAFVVPLADRWDALWAAEAAERAARASEELAARPPDDGSCPSRPAAPELPPGAWAVIMDRAASCRCAGYGCFFCFFPAF